MTATENIDMEKTNFDNKHHNDLTFRQRIHVVTNNIDRSISDNENIESLVEELQSKNGRAKIEAATSLSRMLSQTRETMGKLCLEFIVTSFN